MMLAHHLLIEAKVGSSASQLEGCFCGLAEEWRRLLGAPSPTRQSSATAALCIVLHVPLCCMMPARTMRPHLLIEGAEVVGQEGVGGLLPKVLVGIVDVGQRALGELVLIRVLGIQG